MKYDYSLVVVPQREDEVARFDWEKLSTVKPSRGKTSFSVIDECTGIHGKLVARNTFIHGEIQGLVFAEHVTVEKTGSVHGVIFCRTLTVFGHVKADIICDSVLVRGDGTLHATLKYKTLKLEAGAHVSGRFERRLKDIEGQLGTSYSQEAQRMGSGARPLLTSGANGTNGTIIKPPPVYRSAEGQN